MATGTGTLVLSGLNTYTGGTIIDAGTLSISSDSNLGASGGITLASGTLNATGNVSGSRAVTLNTGTDTFNIASGMTFAETGLFSGGTGAILTMATGTGTLVLSNTNTYSGGTVLDAGTLDINSASAIGTGNFTIAGGNFDNTTSNPITLSHNVTQNWNSSFTFGGTSSLNLGTGAVTLGTNPTVTVSGSTLTVGGIISGSHSISESGAGTLLLTGNNSYTGGLTINGTVEVAGSLNTGDTALGSGTTTVESGGTLIGGETDAFGYWNDTAPGTIAISGGTVTDLGTSSYRITLPNLTFTGGSLVAALGNNGDSQGGNYSLFGTSDAAAVTTDAASTTAMISGGSVSIQSATTFNIATATVSGGLYPGVNLAVTSNLIPFNNTIESVTVKGGGVLLLSGNDSYTGTTTIDAGTLYIDGTDSGLGNVSIPNSITASTTLGGTGTIGLATNDTLTLTGKSGTVLAILSPGDTNTSMATLSVGTTGHNNTVTFGADSELSLGVGAGNNDELAVVGTLNTSSTSDILALNLGSLDQGKYTLMTYTTLSHGTNLAANGGFATLNLTGVSNPAYHLELNTGETDLVHRETIGTITATPTYSSIITGGTDPFSFTIQNTAPTGSDPVTFNTSNVSNVVGSQVNGSVVAGQTSNPYSGLSFDGTAVGASQTGTFSVIDSNSTSGSQTGTVTVNVLDHALASATVTAGNNFDAFVNSGALAANVNLAAAATDGGGAARAGLQVGGTSANLSGGTIGVISAGSSSDYSAAFNAASTAGTQNVNVSFNTGDDQSLPGASAVGNANVTATITGSVFDHAAIPNQILNPVVTQGQTVDFNYSLSNPLNGSALRDGAAVSGVSADGNGYTSGFSGTPTITAGASSPTYTGSFTASSTAAASQVYSFTYGDQDTYQGYNNNNQTATVTVAPTVAPLVELVPTNSNAIAYGRQLLQGTQGGTNPEAGGTTNNYTMYVTNNGNGTFTTAPLTNLNAEAGYLYMQVDDQNGNPSSFGSNPIDLFFSFDSGESLTGLESDLTAFDYTWYDASGNYSAGNGQEGNGNTGDLSAMAAYQLEIVVPSVPNDPVLDFDFSNPAYGDPTVSGVAATSIDALPEPATSMMLSLGAMGVLLKRRRRRTIAK